MTLNIVITGVGGQGTLLASRVLGALAGELNEDVKVSEVHGMSQRGGNVVTYVRIGSDVASPVVDAGSADYVLAFERLEALRALPYLKKGGTMIVNTQEIAPMPVITGAAAYPSDVLERLTSRKGVVALDALALAVRAGEARAVNLVLLGVLCALLDGDAQLWARAIGRSVPGRFLQENLKAFDLGFESQVRRD